MEGLNVVAVIQARMQSSRLPGKTLLDICGRSMLDRVVGRTRRAVSLDRAVVATGRTHADDAIQAECDRLDVPCFRGSDDDVLDRYYRAACAGGADVVVRITADCPLIDAGLIDRVTANLIESGADFAANTLRRTYPRGLDVEVATAATLARAWAEASEPYQRTHVMPFIYQNPEMFRLSSVTGEEDFSHLRWTVDTQDDLALVRAAYRRLPADDAFDWRDVLRLIEAEPSLADLNRHVRQKELQEC